MSLGFHEQRRRRRSKVRWALLRWTVLIALLFAAGFVTYRSGARLAQYELSGLRKDKEELIGLVDELRRRSAEQEAAVEAQRFQAEEWRRRYERDVPSGRVKQLFDLVNEKLDAGIDPDRLEFVIGAVQNERECDSAIETKRFIVRTRLYRGKQDFVRFADGALTVTARGEPARDAEGRPEEWFDPATEVTLEVKHIGGEAWETTGILPLQQSVVVGDREYRFNVVPSARGFVEVSFDSCAYP